MNFFKLLWKRIVISILVDRPFFAFSNEIVESFYRGYKSIGRTRFTQELDRLFVAKRAKIDPKYTSPKALGSYSALERLKTLNYWAAYHTNLFADAWALMSKEPLFFSILPLSKTRYEDEDSLQDYLEDSRDLFTFLDIEDLWSSSPRLDLYNRLVAYKEVYEERGQLEYWQRIYDMLKPRLIEVGYDL